MNCSSPRSIAGAGLCALWLVATGTGFLLFQAYQARPGDPGSPPGRWPEGSGVERDRTRPTLLAFVHPRCPCSAATLGELGEFARRLEGRFAGHLIAYRPDRPGPGRDRAVEAPPGFELRDDPGGREASRFGVETSGHVLLFDPSGRLLFSGGITASRGHRGANPGLEALVDRISRRPDGPGRSPVFGCGVFADRPGSTGGPGRSTGRGGRPGGAGISPSPE